MSNATSPFKLAACAEMLFQDLPIVDRVHEISRRGFMVEIWDWTRHDLKALKATGAVFSSMTGYIEGGFLEDDAINALLSSAEKSISVAKELGIPRLNLHGTGLGPTGLPVKPEWIVTPNMWLKARDTLLRVADLGAKHDVMFVLENLNADVDHPGVPFGKASDCLALIEAVDHPSLRLMLDLYHAQIGEGNLISLLKKALPYIGEVQVADVPGRCEPGTGEIAYPAIAKALVSMGYTGPIGLEAWAEGSSAVALDRFRAAFTLDDKHAGSDADKHSEDAASSLA